ncbi:MAG: hypothetical protein SGJ19_06670 [Planctomycetia bacterium]|nr:hypothetical protein [Planctomycetia bacterium]
MSLALFTLLHIVISVIGIVTGFGALAGMLAGKLLPRWTAWFLVTTAVTSVTGFFFPFRGFTPAIGFGIVSLVILGVAAYALYGRHLSGGWRKAFLFCSLGALYLNTFVLVVQFFQKFPSLVELAPTQSEAPFAVSQRLLLVTFIWLGWAANGRFRA